MADANKGKVSVVGIWAKTVIWSHDEDGVISGVGTTSFLKMKLLNEGMFAVVEEAETEKASVLEDMSSILKPFESFVAQLFEIYRRLCEQDVHISHK